MFKLIRIAASTLALFTLTFAGFAQTPNQSATPEDSPAKTLLKQVAETYRNLKRYHFEGRFTSEMTTESMGVRGENKHEEIFVLAANKPDQSRTESRNPTFSLTVITDGKLKWEYAPGLAEYTQKQVGEKGQSGTPPRPSIDPLTMFMRSRSVLEVYGRIADRVKDANLLGEEVLTLEGQRIPCAIVEIRTAAVATSTQSNQSVRKLWIDKARNLVLREEMQNKARMYGTSQIDTKMVYTFTIARLNEQVSDDLFAFTCPAGAKEVAELNTPFRAPTRVNWTGKDAVAFTLSDLNGKSFDLASLKGQVVLLDFWATWCGPCVAEMPHIQQLHQDFKDKGLLVLGVDDEEADIPRAYMKDKGYTFASLVDTGRVVAKQYEVSGIPQLLLIGRDGKVKWHTIGYGPGKELELRTAVEKVLKGEDPAPSSSMEGIAPAALGAVASSSTNATPPKQIKVSSGVLQSSATKKVQPAYPAQAKADGVAGTVQVQVTISETGKVTEAVIVSGPEALREACLQAAKQWEFKPIELSGVPVTVQGILNFNFSLQ